MVDVIVTMLTLVLFASGFGRLHRLAQARREATDRALIVAHAEWAEANGGTMLDPGDIGVRTPWLEVLAQVRAEIDGHEVQIRSGRYSVGGEDSSDEPRTTCTVGLSAAQPGFSVHPRMLGWAVGRGIGPPAFDRRFLLRHRAHAQALLSSDSRALLLRLSLPDQLDRAVALELTGDFLQLSATGQLASHSAITVLADAALTLASSIEAAGPGIERAPRPIAW
jgi:hypothetical protein